MVEQTVEIINIRGLHARAAAQFVRVVEKHQAKVLVMKDGSSVCGSSIMGLLMLSAGKGTQISISAEGDDADTVMGMLVALVENMFGEEA